MQSWAPTAQLGHIGKKSGRGFYLWETGEIVGENPAARR